MFSSTTIERKEQPLTRSLGLTFNQTKSWNVLTLTTVEVELQNAFVAIERNVRGFHSVVTFTQM